MARPSQLTDKVQESILEKVREGAPYKDAAIASGISYGCYRGWINQGNKDNAAGKKSAFGAFVAALKEAESACKCSILSSISKAGERDWRAKAWIASVKWPEEFSQYRAELNAMKAQLTEALKLLDRLKPPDPPPPSDDTPK